MMQIPAYTDAPRNFNVEDLEWITYQNQQQKLHQEYQQQQVQMNMLRYEVEQQKNSQKYREQEGKEETVVTTEHQCSAHVNMVNHNRTVSAFRDLPMNCPPSQHLPLKGILKDTPKYILSSQQALQGFSKSHNASHYATLPRKYRRNHTTSVMDTTTGHAMKNKSIFDGKENECRLLDSLHLQTLSSNTHTRVPPLPNTHGLLEFKDLEYFGGENECAQKSRRDVLEQHRTVSVSTNSKTHCVTHGTKRISSDDVSRRDPDHIDSHHQLQHGSQLSHGNDKEHILAGKGKKG